MFTGYNDKTVDFFWQIRFNNSREWFAPRKQEFADVIMNPTKELANELFDWFTEQYPKLGLNVHISRIYRDARRLFGKGPLKDHIWFSFQNEIGPRELSPCFWFELGCNGYGYGMGNWAAPAVAARYRKLIDLAPEKFDALARRFEGQDVFRLEGENYARQKGHADERIGQHGKAPLCAGNHHFRTGKRLIGKRIFLLHGIPPVCVVTFGSWSYPVFALTSMMPVKR